MEQKAKATEHTRSIFVKDEKKREVRATCPRDRTIELADARCWKCEHNMRLHHNKDLPSFTIECNYPY